MDFAMSKENIQPLRGGRNAAQLEAGLQAQHNPQYQEELMMQKQQFENSIRNYIGDDPLENYYQYIYWVEQSFPKNGHEGNFVNLLEDCLGRFENEPQYQNDLRMCKLWIKYIDLQYNHTELYQLLYAKRICVGCTDMYKAWAYYHEAAGDYKRAEQVFQLGRLELAQPFQELELAHHNFIVNAGYQMINNAVADTRRLAEQRQALTKLQTLKGGQVGSMRVPTSAGGGGILPMNENRPLRHEPVNVHEDYQDILFGGGAAPVSILGAVKRDAPKENVMKAGVWTGGVKRRTQIVHKTSSIPVHCDVPLPPHELGIQLSVAHVLDSMEDFSQWKVPLTLPDPDNANHIAMYPKAQCYPDQEKEFSIEELRARRYIRRMRPQLSLDASRMETDTTMNSSMNYQHVSALSIGQSPHRVTPYISPPQQQQQLQMHPPQQQYSPMHPHVQAIPFQSPHYAINTPPGMHHLPVQYRNSPMHQQARHQSPYRHMMPYDQHQQHSMPMHQSQHQQQPQHQHQHQQQHPQNMHQQSLNHSMSMSQHMMQHPQQSPHMHSFAPPMPLMENTQYNEPKTYANLTLQSPQAHASYHNPNAMRTINDTPHHDLSVPKLSAHNTSDSPSLNMTEMWAADESPLPPIRPQPLAHFSAYADSPQGSSWYQPQLEPKGNAMKTPIKILSDDELAETGSRGGLDIAAAAQPTDCAKRLFVDDDVGNTEVFNLNAMHVSTPENKPLSERSPPVEVKSTKKRLFCGLADITEEDSNVLSGSSANSGSQIGSRMASGVSRPSTMEPIREQSNYHFNLSQNMKANAELRSKLGMDCESGSESPSSAPVPQPSAYETYHQEQEEQQTCVQPYEEEPQQHVPYSVLNLQPSDPFTNKVLETLLSHVNFPGRHRRCYQRINGVPKLALKKDPCFVGHDRFLVDKILGKGSYGNVYKATRCDTGEVVALKLQKPPNKWEFYICKEIQARLTDHPLRDCFMDIHVAYFSDQASVLLSDVHSGSLLDLINSMKVNLTNGPKHHLSIHLTSEMMKIVQALHGIQIIHADIKPDNFLVMAGRDSVRLQLIDFGCSIDMSLMPEGTTFTRKVKTVSFQCCEMKDDRPWSYHTDLFCIAATAHVLLFENYIDMKKMDGRWCITKKIPRYYRDDLWSLFFSSMLNMQDGLADLDYLISFFAETLDPKELRSATTYIINTFRNR